MGYRLCVTQAKNGVISHRNLVLAIKGCHMDRPCLFGRDIELDAARISASLRQLVAKYLVPIAPTRTDAMRVDSKPPGKACLGEGKAARSDTGGDRGFGDVRWGPSCGQ